MSDSEALIQVRDLTKYFPVTKGIVLQRKTGDVRAVDGISFEISERETLGLVGESGCGKTTAGRTMLGLYPATSGSVLIDGIDVCKADNRQMLLIRRKAQMIFQDPFASLNPRWTVNAIVSEPIRVHGLAKTDKERSEQVRELMSSWV